MKRMRGRGDVEIVLRNPQGYYIANFFINADTQFFRLNVCTEQGKVIPMIRTAARPSASDRPVFKDAIFMTRLKQYKWTAHVTLNGRSSGLRMNVNNALISGEYKNTGEEMLFTLKMGNVPRMKISGAAYGIIPVAIIDLFIPGTVNGLMHDFVTIMFNANHNEGSFFRADWHKKALSGNWLQWKVQTELMDNDYIITGSKMFSKKFSMDDEATEEWHGLATMGVQFLLNDIRNMKK